MAYCKSCGSSLDGNEKFCPVCGTANEPKKAGATCASCGAALNGNEKFCSVCGAANASGNTGTTPGNEKSYFDAFTPGESGEAFSVEDVNENKVFAILSYIGILFIVPLLVAKESPYARFHANQGLLIFLFEIAVGIVSVIPILGWIITAVGELAAFVLSIIGIINAIKGEANELPIIGKFRIIN